MGGEGGRGEFSVCRRQDGDGEDERRRRAELPPGGAMDSGLGVGWVLAAVVSGVSGGGRGHQRWGRGGGGVWRDGGGSSSHGRDDETCHSWEQTDARQTCEQQDRSCDQGLWAEPSVVMETLQNYRQASTLQSEISN